MGHKRCFISGCYHKQDDENETRTVGYFCVPLPSLQAWQRLINKPGLTTSSRICSRHFDESDITKGRTILDVFYPYRVWRLNAGAMPKYHLGNGSDNNTNSTNSKNQNPNPDNQGSQITVLKENLAASSNSDVLKSKAITIQDPRNKSLPGPTSVVVVDSNSTKQHLNDPLAIPTNEYAQQPNLVSSVSTLAGLEVSEGNGCPRTESQQNPSPAQMSTSPSTNPDSQILQSIDDDHMYCMTPGKVVHAQETHQQPTPNLTPPAVKASVKYCLKLDSSDFLKISSEVNLPSKDWHWSFNERKKNLFCTLQDFSTGGKLIVKSVQILNVNKALFYINGKSVVTPELNGDFQNNQELTNVLATFDSLKPCLGIENSSLESVEVSKKFEGMRDGNVWKSKHCNGFAEKKNTCDKCRSLKGYLMKRKRSEASTPDKKEDKLKKKLRARQQIIRRMTRHKEAADALATQLRNDCRKLASESFERKLKYLSEKERMIVKLMVMKSEMRPGRDNRLTAIRYDPAFLTECELIRKKSSIAYRYLRNSGILPLPSFTTLDRLRRKSGAVDSEQAIIDMVSSGEMWDQNVDVHEETEREDSIDMTFDCVDADQTLESVDADHMILSSESATSPEMTVVIISTE